MAGARGRLSQHLYPPVVLGEVGTAPAGSSEGVAHERAPHRRPQGQRGPHFRAHGMTAPPLLPSVMSPVARLHTMPVPARAARTIDPRCEEVTWLAWRLRGAQTVIDEAPALAGSSVLARALETLAMPGRVSAFTDLAWDPASRTLAVSLAVGLWGPTGATQADAQYLAAHLDARLNEPHLPFSVIPADPRPLLELTPADTTHATLIRQRTVDLDVRGGPLGVTNVEMLSRFNPVANSSENIARALVARTAPTRFRATVLTYELGPDDVARLDEQIRAVSQARRNTVDYPEQALTLERAERTLLDVKASFGSVVFISELALISPQLLPEVFVRTVAGAFTSDLDVLRRRGATTVAGQTLLLGGHEHEPAPPDHLEALRAGVPVTAGTRMRTLRDLVTLTECPLAWPVPVNEPIPGLPTTVARPRPRVDALIPTCDPGTETILGVDPQGLPVAQPQAVRCTHTVITGSPGTGKTTVVDLQQAADVAVGRALLSIDFHGTQHDRVLARHHQYGLSPLVLSASDGRGVRMALLPALRYRSQLEDAAAAAHEIADVFTSHLPAEWAGVVFRQLAEALLEMASAHEVEIGTALTWLSDPVALRAAAEHPALSRLTRSVLLSLAQQLNSADGHSKVQWVQAKFSSLTSGPGRRLLAGAGQGVELGQALLSGRSVLVDLSGMTSADASVAAHLILGRVLDHVMAVGPDADRQISVYVDEAHRAVPRSMERAWAEARKFGLAFTVATQTHQQFTDVARDLALGAGTVVALRQSPAAAEQMQAILDVPARELTSLPNLEALVRVTGEPAVTVTVPVYDDLGPLSTREPSRPLPSLDLTPEQARQAQKARIAAEAHDDNLNGNEPDDELGDRSGRRTAGEWALDEPDFELADNGPGTVDESAATSTPTGQAGSSSRVRDASPTESRLDAWLRVRRDLARQDRRQDEQTGPAACRDRDATGGAR